MFSPVRGLEVMGEAGPLGKGLGYLPAMADPYVERILRARVYDVVEPAQRAGRLLRKQGRRGGLRERRDGARPARIELVGSTGAGGVDVRPHPERPRRVELFPDEAPQHERVELAVVRELGLSPGTVEDGDSQTESPVHLCPHHHPRPTSAQMPCSESSRDIQFGREGRR